MKNLTFAGALKKNENVIHNFFKDYPISFIEQMLWNFYSRKVFMAQPNEEISIDIDFFEDLVRVLKKIHELEKPNEPSLVTFFNRHTYVSLEGVINLIKQAIPVGIIYNLSKAKDSLDLIIVLEKSCTKAYTEFENVIDLAMLGYEKGSCTIHNYGLLNAQLKNGHLFYTKVCIERNVVYRKDAAEVLSTADEEKVALAKQMASTLFKNGMAKAAFFYDGAQHYFNTGAFEMTMFMLHQACELTYRCLLNVIRGKDLKCHSPAILRKHIKRFAPEIIGVFSSVEEEELSHLQLLENAYIQSRYQHDYVADQLLISFLNERVGILIKKAKAFLSQFT